MQDHFPNPGLFGSARGYGIVTDESPPKARPDPFLTLLWLKYH
jgi:hypothetical protein